MVITSYSFYCTLLPSAGQLWSLHTKITSWFVLWSNDHVFSFMLRFPSRKGKGILHWLLSVFSNCLVRFFLATVYVSLFYVHVSINLFSSHIYAVLIIQYVNVTFCINLQGFCLCGSGQLDPSSEVSCLPLWLTRQEHRHQPTWDVLKGSPLLHLIKFHD